MNSRIGRTLSSVGVAALALVAAACPEQPPGSAAAWGTFEPAFTCVTPGPDLVVFAGDSLMGQWPPLVAKPEGARGITLAVGGAGFAQPQTGDAAQSMNMAERVVAQLDACGNDIGLLVLSGGVNDLAVGQPVQPLLDGAADLAAELDQRGVPAVWLPITPWAIDPPLTTEDFRYSNRATFNDWLVTPGNTTATVIDCNLTLADPASESEALLPAYFQPADAFGNPDRFHPNLDGYRAFADCLSPVIASYVD